LQAEQRNAENAVVPARRHSAVLRFDEEVESDADNWVLPRTLPRDNGDASGDGLARNGIADTASEIAAAEEAGAHTKSADSDEDPHDARALPAKYAGAAPPLLGESTSAGGLFFLMHVLRDLGMAALVHRYAVLAEVDFAGHILRCVADKAAVRENDPIRMCLPAPDAKLQLPDELLRDAEFARACVPAGFHWPAASLASSDALLRIWTLAVRRWCWRTAHLTLAQVVCRKGNVWLTRTDLDVTFPLALADIRVRRVGLDIDPGWVPWLGLFGKVVRFHYRER
jgi:hypothetical protein